MASGPRKMSEGILPCRRHSFPVEDPDAMDPDMDPGDFNVDVYGTKVRVPWSKVEAAQKRFQDQVGVGCSTDIVTCGPEMHSALTAPIGGMKDRFRSDTLGYNVSSSSGRTMKQLRESTNPNEARGTWSVILRSMEQFRRKVKRATEITLARLQEEAKMCNAHDMLEFQQEMREKAEACLGIGQGDGNSNSLERAKEEPVINVGIYDHLLSFLPLIGLGDEMQKTVIIELPKEFEEQINKKKGRRKGKEEYHTVKVYKEQEPRLEPANAKEAVAEQDDEHLSTRRVDEEANLSSKDEEAEVRDDEEDDISQDGEVAVVLDDEMSDITEDSEAVVIESTEKQRQNERAMEQPTNKTHKMLGPSQKLSRGEHAMPILPISEPNGAKDMRDGGSVEESKKEHSQREPKRSIKHSQEEAEEVEHQSASVWKKLKRLTKKKKRIASTLFGETIEENKSRAAKSVISKKKDKDPPEKPGSDANPVFVEQFEEHISTQPERKIGLKDGPTPETAKQRTQKQTPISAQVGDEIVKTGSTEPPEASLKESFQEDSGLTKEQSKKKQKRKRRDRVKADKWETKDGTEKKPTAENEADKSVKATPKDESITAEPQDDQRDDDYYWRKSHSHLRQELEDSRNEKEEQVNPQKRYFRSRKAPAFLRSLDESVGTFEVFAAYGKTELKPTPSTQLQEENAIAPTRSEKEELPIIPINEDDGVEVMKTEVGKGQNESSSLEEELSKLRQSHAAVFADGFSSIRRHTRPQRIKPALSSIALAGKSYTRNHGS